MHLLKEGQIVNGKWTVERFLGKGAFAEVYRVRHKIFGRQAMKVFKRVGLKIEEVEEILHEPILLARINHPNIIRVFDADTTETPIGTCCFFTMEYIAGGTLEQFWKSYGDKLIPVDTAVDIIEQVCKGLVLAHSNTPPIVHRDIKPQNILVGYNNTGLRACIADFGLAKNFNSLTLALTGLGTRVFKPPEVIANLQADSPAGDIWALGTCFYLILTDRFPFSEDFDLEGIDIRRFESPLTAPNKFNIAVDDTLNAIVYRCLSLNHKERYQNAMSLFEALKNWRRQKNIIISKLKKPQKSNKSQKQGNSQPEQNRTEAERMAQDALTRSQYVGQLSEAADLMEEAFNKWSDLRKKFEYKVTMWRKGISA